MDKEIKHMGDLIRMKLVKTRANGQEQKKPSSQTMGISSGQRTKFTPAELENAGIYKRYQNVTFSAIEHRKLPENKTIVRNYDLAKKYAQQSDEKFAAGQGLIFAGGYGTMKTTMAVAILRDWLEKGHRGLFVPMCSLMDNLYTMKALNKEEFARYDKRIRSTPLLILDDLGGEDSDKWVNGKVDSIITERYNKMLPTIITTNMTPEELAKAYSRRIIDRLCNTSPILVFNDESQRRKLWGVNSGAPKEG